MSLLKLMNKKTWTIAIAAGTLVSAGCFLDNASSQTSSKEPTVSTPPQKPPAQAIQDLKKEVPLDPSKLGDPLPRNLWVELSKLINPTVVSITTTQGTRQQRSQFRDPLQEFLEEFYGGRGYGAPPPRQRQPAQALGTGFIIREDGLIITNNHVIEQADVIKIQLDAGSDKLYEAEIIGRDPRTDIALIKIDAKKPLPVARLGSSKDVQVGEWVAAFGNPYGHAHTMTTGIVSAIGREIAELNRFPFIQTDASINPGNSGGPLVNSQGLVIGVNTAIDARAQGIGFAIPIDNVKQIVASLEKDGRVRRGYIGVNIAPISEEIAASLGMEEPQGVLIAQVMPGGPADKSGIKPYDLVLEFAGKKTNAPADLSNAVGDMPIGQSAKAKVWRYDQSGRRKELTLNVAVQEYPDERRANRATPKQYFGQKAPFDYGFKVADWTDALAKEFDLRAEVARGPVVTEVDRGSPAARAGLQAGDVVLDINRVPVPRAADVLKALKKGRNIVRLARGDMAMILTLGQ